MKGIANLQLFKAGIISIVVFHQKRKRTYSSLAHFAINFSNYQPNRIYQSFSKFQILLSEMLVLIAVL